MKSVRWAVDLDIAASDGSTRRQHSEALLRRKDIPQALRAKATATLTPPPLKASAVYLLELFMDINGTRRMGASGWERLSWVELEAYLRIQQVELAPWEAKLIKAMDSAWLTAVSENSKEQT